MSWNCIDCGQVFATYHYEPRTCDVCRLTKERDEAREERDEAQRELLATLLAWDDERDEYTGKLEQARKDIEAVEALKERLTRRLDEARRLAENLRSRAHWHFPWDTNDNGAIDDANELAAFARAKTTCPECGSEESFNPVWRGEDELECRKCHSHWSTTDEPNG